MKTVKTRVFSDFIDFALSSLTMLWYQILKFESHLKIASMAGNVHAACFKFNQSKQDRFGMVLLIPELL